MTQRSYVRIMGCDLWAVDAERDAFAEIRLRGAVAKENDDTGNAKQ